MKFYKTSRLRLLTIFLYATIVVLIISCQKKSNFLDDATAPGETRLKPNNRVQKAADGPFAFPAPVYDIAATPSGSILVGLNNGGTRSIQIINNGEISTMATVDVATDIQGIAVVGDGNAFFTTGGSDLAQNGELYRISQGNVRMVADLAAFERNHDPDATAGPMWKKQACEAIDGFNAGPQNNPFKVTAASGGKVLVPDAAGNTLLSATTSGKIDWLAIFTPPLNANGDYMIRWEADEATPCYVQPVPTSVAIAPNGDVYVGELTGALSEQDGLPIGLSRVWKIRAGAEHVVCSEKDPSPNAEVFINGLTSVIDIAFGPDGLLYVVEYDRSSWIASFVPGLASGGRVSAYNSTGELVKTVASDLQFPSAITFDKGGHLWVLENNATFGVTGKNPTVRRLN